MADREININAKIANLQKIKEELSKVTVNFKVESKQVDELIKLSKSGLNIKVHLDFGQQLKELLDLQKKGISIKAGITGAQQLRSTTQKEVYGPPTGGARSARDVALTRANEIAAKEEAAFRQRVNIQHQKNVLNEQALQRAEQARALEREQNDRKLRTLQEAQLQRAKKAQQEEDAFRKRMAKADRSIFSSGRTFYGGSGGTFYTDSQFAEETKHRSIQQAAIAEQRKAERAYNNRLLKDLQLAKIQRYKQAASLDGSFTEFVNGVPVGSRSKINPSQVLRQQRAAQQAAANSGLAIGPNGVIYGYSSAQGKSFAQGQYRAGAKQQQSQQAASQAFQNQFNQALASNFTQANSPLFGGFGGPAPAPFSAINPAQQIRVKALAEAQRKLDAAYARRLEKAQDFVTNSPLKAFLGVFTGDSVHEEAAKKYNVKRRDITSRPSYFDPKRIFKDGNFQDILYTGLLGGPAQGIGAALGAATFDKGGSLIGANVAAATVAVFNKISEAMTSAVRAGAEYERAVTGITGIFSATSEIIGPEGNPLPIRQQLGIQNQRAEGIQRASQRALLPLGITGATSSALTQSLSAGLAQRGLAPDEKSTEILLRRFGAAIQTLQPELASDPNLIRRGFEDIIGGGPQASRTELGSAIRGLAPGLFSKNIKSVDDIIKATSALEELVVAIQNNDKATIEWRRALGSLELAQQEVGKGILEGIAPGLKTLADELQKADTTEALRELGRSLGELGSVALKLVVPGIKGATDTLKAFAKAASGDKQGAGAAILDALVRNTFGTQKGDEGLDALNQKRTAKGLPGFRRDNTTGQLVLDSSNLTGDEGLDALNKKRLEQGKFAFRRDEATGQLVEDKSSIIQSIQSLLQTAKNRFGIEDPTQSANDSVNDSVENKLFGLNQLRSQLRKRLKSGEFTAEIGLNSQEIALRRQAQQEKNELFDSGDFGQQRRALDEKGGLRDQIKLAEDIVSKRKALLRIEQAKSDKTEESVAQARLAVQKAEKEAIKLRNEVANKEKELAERRLSIFQKELASIDQTTFAGKDQALKLSKDFNFNQGLDIDRRIAAQDAIINSKSATAIEIQAAKDRRSELLIEQQGNQAAKAQDQRQGARNELNKLAFGIQQPLRREAQEDALAKSNLELKSLEISTKELVLEQNKLSRATKDAAKALDDYTKNARLRELGREGEELAAAEAIVAAGGTVPAGVSESLVRGSASFDPEARALFEQELAREKFNQVSRDNTYARTNQEGAFGSNIKALQDDQTRLGLDQERLNLKPEELALQKRSILRDQKTQLIDNARAAQESLEQDPGNPQLQTEYQQAYQKLQELKQQEITTKTTSPALGAPYGTPSTVPPGTINPDGSPASFSESGTFLKNEKPGDKERFRQLYPHIYDGLRTDSFRLNGDELVSSFAPRDYFNNNPEIQAALESYINNNPGLSSDFRSGVSRNLPKVGPGGLMEMIPTILPKLGNNRDSTGLPYTGGVDLSYNSYGGYGNREDLNAAIKGAGQVFDFDPTKETMEFPDALDVPGRVRQGNTIPYIRKLLQENETQTDAQILPRSDATGQLLNYNTTIGPGGLPNPEMLVASAFDADTKRFNPYKLDYTNTESTLQRINSEFGSGKNIKYPTDEINESVGKLRKLFNKEEKVHTETGNSIFDDLTALKPLTQEQMTVAFSNALQQNFV